MGGKKSRTLSKKSNVCQYDFNLHKAVDAVFEYL